MATNTVRLHRVLRATPERVYRAFLDPDAMAKWLPPNGFTGKVHRWTPKSAARYKMSFTNFTTGKSHSFGGKYLELMPHERIRYTDKFDDPNLPGRNAGDHHLEESLRRHGIEHRAGRNARRHSRRGVLSRLAGIADAAGETGRGGDSGLTRCSGRANLIAEKSSRVVEIALHRREGDVRSICPRRHASHRGREVLGIVEREGVGQRAAARRQLEAFHEGASSTPTAVRRRCRKRRCSVKCVVSTTSAPPSHRPMQFPLKPCHGAVVRRSIHVNDALDVALLAN